MSELGPRARTVLAQVRSADRPTSDDRARVGALLAARIAALPVPVAGPAGAPATPSAAGGLAAKALLLSALVGAGSFTAGYFVGRSDSPPSRAVEAPSSKRDEVAPAADDRPSTAVDPKGPGPETAEPATAEPASTTPPAGAAPLASTPRAPTSSAASAASEPAAATGGSLAEETALLGAARAALGRGEVPAALAKLDEMGERHPAGVLREERMATRVMALCAAGRTDEARAEAQRFLQETPRSLQAARVRASCVFAKP